MVASGQTTTKTSARKANATTEDVLFERAEKAAKDLRNHVKPINKEYKQDIATIIDELIEKAKQTTVPTTAADTGSTNANQVEKTEMATQTDKPIDEPTGEPTDNLPTTAGDSATIKAID